MNPDFPPSQHDTLEARITALLLGELTPAEAAEVQAAIAQDPALGQLRDRLQRAIGFVRELHAQAAPQPKLSAARRQKLLGHFKVIAPKELPPPRWRTLRWFVPMSAAAALILLLVAALLPSLAKAKAKGQRVTALSRQHAEVLRQRLVEAEAPASNAGVPGRPVLPATEAGQSVDKLEGFQSGSSWRARAANGTQEELSEQLAPARSSRRAEPLARGGAVTRGGNRAGAPAAMPSGGSQIFLPAPPPAADEATTPARLDPSAGVGKAPAVGGTPPPPMMDVRMMTRYGLVPKGFKANIEADSGSKREPAAAGAESQRASGPPVVSAPQVEAAVALEQTPAKSELAPLPLKLPVPAFMGTPTDIPTEAPVKRPRAEANGRDFGGLAGGGGGVGGGAAAGYGGFGGRPLTATAQNSAEQPAADEQGVLPSLGQTTEGKAVVAGTGLVSQESAQAAEELAPKDTPAEAPATEAAPVVVAAADAGVAYAMPAESASTEQSVRGRAAGDVVSARGAAEPANPPALGDNPTLGRLFRSAAPEPASAPAAPAAPAAQPPSARIQKQAASKFAVGGVADTAAESRLGDRFFRNSPAGTATAGLEGAITPSAVPSADNVWNMPAGTSAAAPAPTAEAGQFRAYYATSGAAPTGSGTAAPETWADFDNDGRLDAFTSFGRPSAGGGTIRPPAQGRAAGQDQRGFSRNAGNGTFRFEAADQELADFSKALAKADQALQGVEPADSKARLHGELPAASETAGKAKVTERYDNAADVALGFAVAPSQRLVTNGLTRADQLEKNADGEGAKLGLVAAGKPTIASPPVTPEALKGVALAEEPPVVRSNLAPPEPQPEVACDQNPFSTFSLNVTDVSFKLAAASLEQGQMPDPSTVRSEEFINAFNYHDPAPAPGVPVAFAWERAHTPFAQNRDLLRFAVQTAARGREAARPLNLVLLLDNSGSMERADRVRIIHEALGVLASQLQPQDRVSVVAFARTARLWVDGLAGSDAGELLDRVGNLTPDGGTNLEDALKLAYETALRHFLSQGVNRVVLLTDGAANLGDVDPESLQRRVESYRKRGVALDCFGIGWEGYNDDLLEVLSRHGDGRYGFVNTPEEATTEFAAQLTGALQVAAADVKVQVEFNPRRVTSWRQIGYAKHQLTKEQFRDNTVDAAELAAAESGNALYAIAVNPSGDGDLGTVRVRYREPATGVYRELEWAVPYTGPAVALEQASPAMRLAAVASAFSEWLAASPFAGEVTTDALLADLRGVPEAFAPDPRPTKLEWMIRHAKSISGQ